MSKTSYTATGRTNGHSGFTLIELLVVIAIIGLLAAILFPVFGRARENARRTSCASNLKQIGLGIVQYEQDYDERTPPPPYVATDPNNSCVGTWCVVQPYLKSNQVGYCPSSKKALNGTQNGVQSSYGGNDFYWYKADENPWLQNIAKFNNTSNAILIGDGVAGARVVSNGGLADVITGGSLGISNTDGLLQDPPSVPVTNNFAYFSGRHFGGCNWLFVDGRVKWMKLETIMAATDSTGEPYKYFKVDANW